MTYGSQSLADLDPFAVEPLSEAPAVRALPPRHDSPLDLDLLSLQDDPLSTHAVEEARKAQGAKQDNGISRSPPRRPFRRLSSTGAQRIAIEPRRESIDAALFVPPSSPPASSVLSQFGGSSRPVPRRSLESNDSFTDFQGASPNGASPNGSLSQSMRATWSALKTSSAQARPALANLFNDISSADGVEKSNVTYFSGAPGWGGDRANSWPSPSPPKRVASPAENAKPPPIRLSGVRPGLRSTLTEDLAEAIRPSLPPRTRLTAAWQLLYSLDQHGASLSTLYKRVSPVEEPCIIVVRDDEGHIFGAFINEPLRRSDSYYGTGECFLWKSAPFGPNDPRIGIGVKAYKWTGRNTYCIFSDDHYINVGGGEGRFGLWIDKALAKGFSARCSTFANDCLCTRGTEDEANCDIIALEIWRI